MHRPDTMVGLIVGAIIAGVVCGLMPLSLGRKYDRNGEGIAGFGLCVLSAFFGGFFLAGPLALMISLAIFVLGPADDPLAARQGFDLMAHEERVETLRALARARKERTELPVPAELPPIAALDEMEHAIQAGPAPQTHAVSESDRTYSTPS